MRIVMDRNTCTGALPACEECFATFVLHDCVPDRACITDVQDDDKKETTLVLKYNGDEAEIVVTDQNRELLAYDGWSQYVDVLPEFFSPGSKRPERLQERATVLLVEQNSFMRDVLRGWLEDAEEVELIGEVTNGVDAITETLDLEPAILVVDVSLWDINALSLAQLVRELRPETKIVLLLDDDDREYREAAEEAGVVCVVKTAAPRRLLPTLHKQMMREVN